MNRAALIVLGIIILSAIGVLGDFLLKLAGQGLKPIDWKLFVIGLAVYASTGVGWFLVMKKINLASLGVIYGITTILLLSFISIFCLKEGFRVSEGIGIVLALIALLLLSRFG